MSDNVSTVFISKRFLQDMSLCILLYDVYVILLLHVLLTLVFYKDKDIILVQLAKKNKS
jgi:hypothetical protein